MSLAAYLTGIEVDYVGAVSQRQDIVLPPGGEELHLNNGTIKNWRTHTNAIRKSVHQALDVGGRFIERINRR